MRFWIFQLLNGLTSGAILFFVAVGLTVVTGLMRVLNLAHGALFLVGGFVGLATIDATGSFVAGLAAGALAAGLLGFALSQAFATALLGHTFHQVLLTLGIAFMISNGILHVFGGTPRRLQPPSYLRGSVELFGVTYPRYRLALIALSVVAGLALWLFWERSLVGAMVRACVDDRRMAAAMGIPVGRVFSVVFALGSALAGLTGVLAAPVLGLYIGLDFEVLLLAVIVIVVGGMGSLTGAFIASMLVGIINVMGQASFPELSSLTLFVPVILILIVRPRGLMGRSLT
jgi:branched-chain amino acid transport system permease protein